MIIPIYNLYPIITFSYIEVLSKRNNIFAHSGEKKIDRIDRNFKDSKVKK